VPAARLSADQPAITGLAFARSPLEGQADIYRADIYRADIYRADIYR
jgi:hypothetical protein